MDGKFDNSFPKDLSSRISPIRFVSPDIKKKYDLELPEYEGIDQVVEVGANGQKL